MSELTHTVLVKLDTQGKIVYIDPQDMKSSGICLLVNGGFPPNRIFQRHPSGSKGLSPDESHISNSKEPGGGIIGRVDLLTISGLACLFPLPAVLLSLFGLEVWRRLWIRRQMGTIPALPGLLLGMLVYVLMKMFW